jgi:hypothetical protein
MLYRNVIFPFVSILASLSVEDAVLQHIFSHRFSTSLSILLKQNVCSPGLNKAVAKALARRRHFTPCVWDTFALCLFTCISELLCSGIQCKPCAVSKNNELILFRIAAESYLARCSVVQIETPHGAHVARKSKHGRVIPR